MICSILSIPIGSFKIIINQYERSKLEQCNFMLESFLTTQVSLSYQGMGYQWPSFVGHEMRHLAYLNII